MESWGGKSKLALAGFINIHPLNPQGSIVRGTVITSLLQL